MNEYDGDKILQDVTEYYSEKILKHGANAKGVDWNSEESQILRFEQLSKIILSRQDFSINDFGCGYGALCQYLCNRYESFSYLGIDATESMIALARQHCYHDASQFVCASVIPREADYTIASGIFNVRLNNNDQDWAEYVKNTLDMLAGSSKIGFAFNCLTAYSDHDYKKDYLYYPDPCDIFSLCKKRYSKNIALLHDYGLYEFTILVRKKL